MFYKSAVPSILHSSFCRLLYHCTIIMTDFLWASCNQWLQHISSSSFKSKQYIIKWKYTKILKNNIKEYFSNYFTIAAYLRIICKIFLTSNIVCNYLTFQPKRENRHVFSSYQVNKIKLLACKQWLPADVMCNVLTSYNQKSRVGHKIYNYHVSENDPQSAF